MKAARQRDDVERTVSQLGRIRVLRKNILTPVSFLCEINVFLLPFRRGASAELDSSEHHDTQVSIQDDRSPGFLSCSEQGAEVVRYRELA
jgi:hypothetical protein